MDSIVLDESILNLFAPSIECGIKEWEIVDPDTLEILPDSDERMIKLF